MDEDFWDESSEEYSERAPDRYFLEAQREIRGLYEDRESVYYLRQLQLMFEKRYFHWVTMHAMDGLYKIGFQCWPGKTGQWYK